MKKYIGGFLELEIFPQSGPSYHGGALALSNARACVTHIIGQTGMKGVWLPYYTCDALLEPFQQANIAYQFYGLTSELEVADAPAELAENEYFLYINYFGLKNEYVVRLAESYGNFLLVDNTQDFFAHGYLQGWGFNSARKSFGVPDGGYLYGPAALIGSAESYPINTDYYAGYLLDRLRGEQEQAYAGFVAYERTLTSRPLRISEFSASLLSQVDYPAVIKQRRANFDYYHAQLSSLNTLPIELTLSTLSPDTVPFCYPLLPENGRTLDRRQLFSQNLFIPMLWPDVLTRQPAGYAWERRLTQDLLPLPVDHRYSFAELDKAIAAVSAHLS